MVMEDAGLVVLGLCLILYAVEPRARRAATLAGVVALGWMVFALKVGVPSAAGDRAQSHFLVARYGQLGSSYGEVASTLLTSPRLWWDLLAGRPVRELLATMGLFPWVAPWSLLGALPEVLLNRAANYPAQSAFTAYYGLPALTVLLLGVPHGLARMRRRWPPILMVLAASSVLWPVVVMRTPMLWPVVTSDDLEAARALAAIPPGDTIVAQNAVMPHLPYSSRVSVFPAEGDPDWLALAPRKEQAFAPPEAMKAELERRLAGGYGAVLVNDTLVLLRRGAVGVADGKLRARLEGEWP